MPPPSSQQQVDLQYNACGGRASITPPHESSQYPSCKINDGLPGPANIVGPASPSPHGPHQMYQNPVSGSPQNSGSVLYPWMRSQFGEFIYQNLLFPYIISHNGHCA